jgi:hypothetical protein
MTSIIYEYGGKIITDIDGSAEKFTDSLNGDVTGTQNFTTISNLDRSKIKSGSNNHVIINDGFGNLSSESQLSQVRGGFGTNVSNFTGILRSVAGNFTAGVITDDDISNLASISRAKIKTGSADHVIINNSSGLIVSEAYLSPIRGGLGTNVTSFNGIIKAVDGSFTASKIIDFDISTSAAINRNKIASGTPNHIILNNSSGILTSSQFLPVANGGLGFNAGLTAGIVKSDGLGTLSILAIDDQDISLNANISRNKIAIGNSNYVLINNGTGGIAEEQYLSQSRGGLGLNTTTLSGFIKRNNTTGVITSSTTIVNTDIDASAAISRTKIANGTANYILINNGTGVISEEQYLSQARGGLGLDSTTLTGFIKRLDNNFTSSNTIIDADIDASASIVRTKIANGTPNYIVINNSSGILTEEQYLSQSRGGLGLNTSTLSGFIKRNNTTGLITSSTTIVNTDIDTSAAISRTKIANGTANYILINNETGVISEEQYLSQSRGGFGVNVSSYSGIIKASSGVFTAVSITNNDISSLASISRSKIASGNADYIIINNSTGGISEEQYLSQSRGGLELDATTLSGFIKRNDTSGLFESVVSITNDDIDISAGIDRDKIGNGITDYVVINNSTTGALSQEQYLSQIRGGLGIDSTSLDGFVKRNNVSGLFESVVSITDSDIDTSAAITRNKLANGTDNYVLINNETGGISEEQYLSQSRGGLALDVTTLSGFIKRNDISGIITSSTTITNEDIDVSAGIVDTKLAEITTSGKVANSATTATSANVANAIITRDSNGDFLANTSTLNKINIGNSYEISKSILTNNNVTQTIAMISTTTNTSYNILVQAVACDTTGATGIFLYEGMVKNISGIVTNGIMLKTVDQVETAITGATIKFTPSGTNILVQVDGVASKTINWSASIKIVYQDF